MARECFCGCGRTIPFHMFGLRTYDTRGRQVRKRIQWAEDTIEHPDEDTRTWLAEGREITGLIAGVVHQERDPHTVSEANIRQWQGEGRAAEREYKRRTAALGYAIRKSGKDVTETMEAIQRGEIKIKDD